MTEANRPRPEECDCCGFTTTALRAFNALDTSIGGGGETVKENFWYCELCSSTLTSSFSRFPGRQPGNMEVMKTVCLVGNKILAAIEAQHDADRRLALRLSVR